METQSPHPITYLIQDFCLPLHDTVKTSSLVNRDSNQGGHEPGSTWSLSLKNTQAGWLQFSISIPVNIDSQR
ncbi:hypothetical protein CapIbe_011599 [Capra ibex]